MAIKSSQVAFNKKATTIALHVNTHVRNKKKSKDKNYETQCSAFTQHNTAFVNKGGKQEKRKFLAKMHQIAPNCVSILKNFPGVTPPDPHPWGGPPARRFAPRLVAFGHSVVTPDNFILPLKQTAG